MSADKEKRQEKVINSIVEACVVLTLALLTLLIFATFLSSHPLSPEETSQKKFFETSQSSIASGKEINIPLSTA